MKLEFKQRYAAVTITSFKCPNGTWGTHFIYRGEEFLKMGFASRADAEMEGVYMVDRAQGRS